MMKLNPDKLATAIIDNAENDTKAGLIGPLAVSVMQDNNIVFEKCFGTVTFGGKDAVDASSLFRLASMTKPITAVAFGVLCDRYGVDLDEGLCRYVPEAEHLHLKVFDEDKNVVDVCVIDGNIPLRRLLNHTSGIGSENIGAFHTDHLPPEAMTSLESAVAYWLREGTAFYPGSRQCYSPTAAFDVAGLVMQRVSGLDVRDFYKKYIFDPCEMADTSFIPSDSQWKRIVWMHNNEGGLSVEQKMNEGCVFGRIPVSYPVCGGGLISSLEDYKNFASMLLNGGIYRGRTIVSSKYMDRMSHATIPDYIMGGDQRWGLGVRVITGKGYRVLPVGAYGWSGAYGTHFWVDPVNRITAVYLKNTVYGPSASTLPAFENAVFEALEQI